MLMIPRTYPELAKYIKDALASADLALLTETKSAISDFCVAGGDLTEGFSAQERRNIGQFMSDLTSYTNDFSRFEAEQKSLTPA
jgi:hypothetical protein